MMQKRIGKVREKGNSGMMGEGRLRFLAIILAAFSLAACGSSEQPAPVDEPQGSAETPDSIPYADAPLRPKTLKIAFNTDRDGNYEVYTMYPDGSGATNLTNNPATDWAYFAGDEILFASDRNTDYRQGDYDLYKLDPTGLMLEKLSRFPVYDSYVSASPDGNRYVVCSRKDGNSELYIIDGSGRVETQLTNNKFEDRDPSWSPGGFRIAFRSNRGGAWDIWVKNVDGSNLRQLTSYEGNDHLHGYQEGPPRWSPAGDQILFSSERDGDFDIYVVRANGYGLTNLTDNEFNEIWASWSPDGRQIAFDSDRDGNYEIYVMNADGNEELRITDHPATDQSPVWVMQ
jgi:TolB protein